MRAFALLALCVALPACVVDLEGAPCETDSNCPEPHQWCQLDGTCTSRTPTLAEACEQVVQIAALKTTSCYGGRPESWHTEIPREQICDAVAASATAETLTFDPSRIRQCKAAILDRACEDIAVTSALEGCEMFAPASALGEPCGSPYDCSEGWCKVSSTCPGSCTAFIADDQACTTADKCQPGSTCIDGSCRRFREISEACSNTLPCDPYLAYCDGNPGVCQPKRQSGGCVLFECEATYRCTPPIFGGTCNVARTVGENCTPGQYQCEALAHCSDVTNQCEPLSTVGDGCGFNFEGEIAACLGSRCAGNTCANFIAPGQPCNTNGECGPLAHCDTVCVPEFCG